MSLLEKGKEFEAELNELRVSELVKEECKEMLMRISNQIDEFLSMIKLGKRNKPFIGDMGLPSSDTNIFKKRC
jgi:hypothetical protein